MSETIAVIGAGHGGCAIAAELALKNHKVNLHNRRMNDALKAVIDHGEEIVLTDDAGSRVARLNMATTDIKKATDEAETIIVVVPAFGYNTIAELLAPVLRNGQLVAFIPGAFATISFLEEMKKRNINADVTFAEMATLPYAARLKSKDSNEVLIRCNALILSTGVFPAKRTEAVIPKLQQYYSQVTGCRDILDVALNNLNPVTHPPPAILSTSLMEKKPDEFYLYRDGITDSVKRVMIAMDKERIEIRKACGIETEHYGYHQFEPFEVFEDFFGKGELVKTGYRLKGPSSLKDRYVTDDVPFGLVFYSTIGEKVGVKTPVCDAITNLACVMNEENYWETGANIEKMFVGSWDIDKLTKFLYEGE